MSKLQTIKSQEIRNDGKRASLLRNTNERSDFNSASKQLSKEESVIVATRAAPTKPGKCGNVFFRNPSQVKASALFYEITERTKELARPRVRIPEVNHSGSRPAGLPIANASPRINELSKPRMIYQHPVKGIIHVSPGALTAKVTQRIIELAKPKRKWKSSANKKGKRICPADDSKVAYRSRRRMKTSSSHRKTQIFDPVYGISAQRRNRGTKKRKITRMKRRSIKSSNSDRTIIVIDLNDANNSKVKRNKFREFKRQ